MPQLMVEHSVTHLKSNVTAFALVSSRRYSARRSKSMGSPDGASICKPSPWLDC